MAIQYLLVAFPEPRAVLADGAGVGFTNHVLMLPGDEYEIILDGGGTVPASQDIALVGTSLVKPLVVVFASATPPAPGTPEAPGPAAALHGPPRPAPGASVGPVAVSRPKAAADAAVIKPTRKVKPDA
jgi:hypothetical protein